MEEKPKTSIISTTSNGNTLALVPAEQVRREAAAAVATIAEAYAKGTRRAYRASWRIFEGWCAPRSIAPVKATPENVATYLEWRLNNGLGARVCVREYSALAAHLREIQPGGPWSMKEPHEIIRRWLQGAKKRAVPAVKKEPLLPEHFAQLADSRVGITARGARDRALLLFGFAGGFRRSELVALDVADVAFDGEGATVLIRRAKTDQEGKGAYVAVCRQEGRRCPVAALETYMRLGGVAEGPIFRAVRSGAVTKRRLNDRAVALVVKEAVASLGLDPKKYAGHSLRCGFVTAAAKRGATIDEIKNTTRHQSADQVLGYIRRATPFERNASKGLLADTTLMSAPTPPEGYESELSTYGPLVCDMSCGETIGWGFRILQRLSEERFEALRKYGDVHCFTVGDWALITRWLTCEEAITLYGPVSSIERGPRGGFRSVTYGAKRFLNRRIEPLKKPEAETPKAKTLQRPVGPLDLVVDVDLYDVIRAWRGRALRADIEPLYAAISIGQVELKVFHVEAMLSDEQRLRIDTMTKEARYSVSGGESHARMAAVGALYLESLGKQIEWEGGYRGGDSDVAAVDGSIVVECGTLNPSKVLNAMRSGIEILVIPYNLGTAMAKENLVQYLLPSNEIEEPLPENSALHEALLHGRHLVRLSKIHFGYLFCPVSYPKRSQGEDDNGRDIAGEVAVAAALPDVSKGFVACSRGHVYETKWIGKYCVRGECKNGVRRDPVRRIEERGA